MLVILYSREQAAVVEKCWTTTLPAACLTSVGVHYLQTFSQIWIKALEAPPLLKKCTCLPLLRIPSEGGLFQLFSQEKPHSQKPLQ